MAGTSQGAQDAGCGAVVLAAGEAKRFGRPKLLMPFGDSTVLGSVVQSLASAAISPIIVVVGENAEEISQALVGQPVRVVRNRHPEIGMVSSARVGVEALPASLGRFVIALGDQPRVTPEGVLHLVSEHSRADALSIVIPTFHLRRGHPVVFDIEYRDEILSLTEQQTLRDVIEAHTEDIVEVELDSDACISDIDTCDDYKNELRRWRDER